MLKKINFLLIILFLFSSLTNHSLAFHKKYKKNDIFYENIDVEKDKIKSSYCAEGVSKKKMILENGLLTTSNNQPGD